MFSFENVYKLVHTQIVEAFRDDAMTKDMFTMQFKKILEEKHIDLRGVNPRETFHIPFQKVVHMTQFRILLDDNEDFVFPLTKMCHPQLDMFFHKETAPNVIIFIPGRQPSAIFTKTGFMTLAGGVDLEDVITCFTICCYKVLFVLHRLYPNRNITVSRFRICNTVSSTVLVKQKVKIAKFIDFVRSHRIVAEYKQDVIGFCYVKHSMPFRDSITFCVSPKGGVNILGCEHDYEAHHAMLLLSYFLRNNTNKLGDITEKDVKKEYKLLEAKRAARKIKKQKTKQKKYETWVKITQKIPIHNIPENLQLSYQDYESAIDLLDQVLLDC